MNEADYIECLTRYSNLINLAIKVSKFSANRQVEDRIVWACVLYTKMCVTGVSIYILTPNSDIAVKKIPHWDFSSLFSLTRNLMECYQTFFYLCIDNVSFDEFKARRKLFNLHDYYSRVKLFSFLGEEQIDKDVEESLIIELTNTDFFKLLSEKQKNHFLKGENAFFVSREDIEEKSGASKDNFKLLYKLFSSNSHSFPMGFYGMLEGERGTGVKSDTEIGYSALALETAEQYFRKATNNMLEFFPDIKLSLTKLELSYLVQ